jgi:hypothetical protein
MNRLVNLIKNNLLVKDMTKKIVSFWARKPVDTKVCFKRQDGTRVCFKAKVPQKTRVRFKTKA